MGKQISVFNIQYWLDKGFTEAEGKYQISIRRPTNKNYWIHKGYSEEEAILKCKSQSRRGRDLVQLIEKYGEEEGIQIYNRRKKDFRITSVRCIEHWIHKGYSEEEAKQQISSIQDTRSYQKSIEKYGQEDGIIRVRQINEKWQNTLKSKPLSEQQDINRRKSNSTFKNYLNKYPDSPEVKFVEKSFRTRDRKLSKIGIYILKLFVCCDNLDDLIVTLSCNTSISFIKRVIRCSAVQYKFKYGEFGNCTIDMLLDNIFEKMEISKQIPGLYGNRYLFNGNVLLSNSELEIASWLKQNGIEYMYSRQYPFSTKTKKYFYDFFIPAISLYIEYAGIMDNDRYKNNISQKIKLCLENDINLLVSDNSEHIITTVNEKINAERNNHCRIP